MSKTILITGANGRIGSALVRHIDACNLGYHLILGDLELAEKRSIKLDISDLGSIETALEENDIYTIVHLAGLASPDTPFEQLLSTNIIGTYNVLQKAHEKRVKRVVFASSAQTIEGYPLDIQVHEGMPVRPKNLYGVSKAFGEALGAYYAYQKQMEVIAIRIGAFEYKYEWATLNSRDLSAWSEPHDICALFINSIEAPLAKEPFVIAHGISDNRFKRLNILQTKSTLGYKPLADAFDVWAAGMSLESKPRL